MTSIYKKALGDTFYQLHPMLQKRYDHMEHIPLQAQGIMKKIFGGPIWLFPFFTLAVKWKLFFPEHGNDIPFMIKHTPIIGKNGEKYIHWERIFYFGKKQRYFNARMSLDQKRNIIRDYLGEPSLLYSDLKLTVSNEGQLNIHSGKQRLILGKYEIPLPKIFQGNAIVTEKFNEESNAFQIAVTVKNPIIGTVFAYEGEFTAHDIS